MIVHKPQFITVWLCVQALHMAVGWDFEGLVRLPGNSDKPHRRSVACVAPGQLHPCRALWPLLVTRRPDQLAGAVQNQAIPLRNVYTELVKRYGEAELPRYLYQVLFICHTQPHTDLRLGEAMIARRSFDQRASKTDMTLNLWVRPDEISGQLEYSTDLYTSATAARIIRRYEEVLTGLVEDLVW